MSKMTEPITSLKGIGPKSKLYYEKLGITTMFDIINYYPKKYEQNRGVSNLCDASLDEKLIFCVVIDSIQKIIRLKKLSILNVIVSDDSAQMKLVFYNQPYLKQSLYVGKKINIRGKAMKKGGQVVIVSPEFLSDKDLEIILNKPLVPIYKLSKKISNKKLIEKIKLAFDYVGDEILDYLPKELKNQCDLIDYEDALKKVHFPSDYDELEEARKRLIFDEFLFFMMALAKIKNSSGKKRKKFVINDDSLANKFLHSLPFELTNSQKTVISDIKKDMFSPFSMNRLIQGDVGSGKTIIATVAALYAVSSGYQVAFMAPTEVLANQHYKSLKKAFKDFDISVAMLTGSVKNSEKLDVKSRLKKGDIDILVATHAVITDDTKFHNLSLVITDEQHRFGVNQRKALVDKGDNVDVIVMSATPIPRTLALILYSDMDLSVNSDMPNGRKPIKTYFVNTSYRDRIYDFIAGELKKGNQCYIVCAKATLDDESELIDVDSYKNMIRDKFSDDVVIQSLHGQMKNKDKNDIMNDFVNGKIHILVSTTVIEVGIDVKDATCIIIENAERFGLSALHQLRGRVGRNDKQSYCILISDSDSDETKERLSIMTKTNDGFEVANKDLHLRGHGDLLGFRQSGIPTFKLANIYDDIDLLNLAKKVANRLILSEKIGKIEYNLLCNRLDVYLSNLEEFIL